jgi:hypothetical protein
MQLQQVGTELGWRIEGTILLYGDCFCLWCSDQAVFIAQMLAVERTPRELKQSVCVLATP